MQFHYSQILAAPPQCAKSLKAVASSSSGGVAELQQVDPGHTDVCQTRGARRGWTWAGQLKFPSALSSREAKLILRLRPL